MQDLLAKKMVGHTELREPKKVLEQANGEVVAVMNRAEITGYFVPVSAVNKLGIIVAPHDAAMAAFDAIESDLAAGMDYLKDK